MKGALKYLSEVTSQHPWISDLKKFDVQKMCLYSALANKGRNDSLSKLVETCDERPPFPSALVSYLGFGIKPYGLLFRNVAEKDFRAINTYKNKIQFYVSQRFEENIAQFSYGDPVILVEGALDAEACAFAVGYPYVMAYLSSAPSVRLVSFIFSITDRVLVIPDNDKFFENNKRRVKRLTSQFCMRSEYVQLSEKDFADSVRANKQMDFDYTKVALKSLDV